MERIIVYWNTGDLGGHVAYCRQQLTLVSVARSDYTPSLWITQQFIQSILVLISPGWIDSFSGFTIHQVPASYKVDEKIN